MLMSNLHPSSSAQPSRPVPAVGAAVPLACMGAVAGPCRRCAGAIRYAAVSADSDADVSKER